MEIEKNVPVPKSHKETLAEMEVGDSVLTTGKKAFSMKSTVFFHKKQGFLPEDFKLKIAKEGDKARVWRIK